MIRVFFFFISLVLLIACNKKQPVENHIPCNRFIANSVKVKLLPEAQLTVIDSLFVKNNLDNSSLQFSGLSVSQISKYTYIYAGQYRNGLKLLWEEAIFAFDTIGTLDETYSVNTDSLNLDAIPQMNEGEVIEIFRDHVDMDAGLEKYREEMRKSCIQYQFGYFNTAMVRPVQGEKYIKAWKIAIPEFGVEMILDDASGRVEYYFNGIRT